MHIAYQRHDVQRHDNRQSRDMRLGWQGGKTEQRLFMMMKWVLLEVRLPTWLVLSEQIFALDKCFQPAGDISTLFIVFFLFLSTRNIFSSKTILFQSKCARQTRTRMVMHSILKVSNSTNHHLTSLLFVQLGAIRITTNVLSHTLHTICVHVSVLNVIGNSYFPFLFINPCCD